MEFNKIPINPCLHCGGKGIIKGRKKIMVVCSKCGAQGPEKALSSQAIASWNKENIVRCKDCRNYNSAFFSCQVHHTCMTFYDTDDYCSKAIRKEKHDD